MSHRRDSSARVAVSMAAGNAAAAGEVEGVPRVRRSAGVGDRAWSEIQVVFAEAGAGFVEVVAGDLAGGEAALEDVER